MRDYSREEETIMVDKDWKCLKCGRKNRKEYKYCPHCGKAKKIEI